MKMKNQTSVAVLFLCGCFLGGCATRVEQPATPDTVRASVALAWVMGTSGDNMVTPDNDDTVPSPTECWNCDGSGTVGDQRIFKDCKICDSDGDGNPIDRIGQNFGYIEEGSLVDIIHKELAKDPNWKPDPSDKLMVLAFEFVNLLSGFDKTQEPGAIEQTIIDDAMLGLLDLLLAGINQSKEPGANPLGDEPLSPELQKLINEFTAQLKINPDWEPNLDESDEILYAWMYFYLSGLHPKSKETGSAENKVDKSQPTEGTVYVPAEPFWTTWEQIHLELNAKPIFVLITFEGCGPCLVFKKLLKDPEIESYLVANYNLVEDDIADWKLPNAPRIAIVPATGGQGINIPTRVAPTSKIELMNFLRSSNPREKN